MLIEKENTWEVTIQVKDRFPKGGIAFDASELEQLVMVAISDIGLEGKIINTVKVYAN